MHSGSKRDQNPAGVLSCEKGTVAVLFGLALIPVALAAGISIDYARALTARHQLQNAADAAAIAGARIPATENQNRANAARIAFEANLAQTPLTGVVPVIEATNEAVVVTASYPHPTTFTSIAGIELIDLTVSTRARSQIENGGVACLLALNLTTSDGLHLQGINKQTAENCWAWVNSNSSTAINAVGASAGKAQGYCTAGGVLGAEHFSPAPYTGCEKMDDPFAEQFASYTPPSSCKATNLELSSGSYVLQPGTYCGGINIKPQANVEFLPGEYVIKDGVLKVQANSSAKGNGVVFYFTGTGAQLVVLGGGNVDFKAPASGPFAGFIFVQDAASNPGSETTIQGGGRVKLEGIVYTPTWRISIGGNGVLNDEAEYFAMVADSFYMEGNGKLYVRSNAEAVGLPSLMPKIPTGPLLLR